MLKLIGFLALFFLLYTTTSNAQFKSILDSKYKKFNIGFKVQVPANQKIQIAFYNQDSSFKKILLDTSFQKKQKVIFLFNEIFESEKQNYSKHYIVPIPNVNSGVYYLEMIVKEKFLITK